jgi:ADP-ribose pyrophosphatase YjhB (NUDIX family)
MMVKKALFMPGQVPEGGACISSFIVAEKDGKVLVGKMRNPETWVEKFLVGPSFAPKYAASGKWLLPASHLKFGESPDECAQRILKEQLLVGRGSCTLMGIQSHVSGDPSDIEKAHWDLCIIYRASIPEPVHVPGWFSELRYVMVKDLKTDDFTRGHGDILEQLGLLGKR